MGIEWGPKRDAAIDRAIDPLALISLKESVQQHLRNATEWKLQYTPEQNDISNLWHILTQGYEPSELRMPPCLLNVELPHPDFVTDKMWLTCLTDMGLRRARQHGRRLLPHVRRRHDRQLRAETDRPAQRSGPDRWL